MDISERKARARPRHHQPVPSQYRMWWGHGPEVRGKGGMVWWWGEGKRFILQLLPKPFWEVRPVGMTDHPKEASLRGNHWMHALKVERESIYTVAGKKCYGGLRNETNLPLSGKGECRTNLVVNKYAQTRQRRLKGKMVKPWSRQAL